jgi:hypothetical protein
MKKTQLHSASSVLFTKISKLPTPDRTLFVDFVMSSFKDIMEDAKWVNLVRSKPKVLSRLVAQAEKEIKNGQFEEFNAN